MPRWKQESAIPMSLREDALFQTVQSHLRRRDAADGI
jgi:hypothetical protein